jgi:pimeloyl-ACP methyl ester carboxylesterase/DNA-binding CsgD family transcriptional regulator
MASFLPRQEIRFCTSRDHTRIAYAICGKGPPLIWAQHWIHHLDLDWSCPIWRGWLELLTQRHTVIRYDWRGCGLSDRDGVEFSLEKYVEDLEAVAEAAGLTRFILFGMSNGAHTAAAYAARHPEHVTQLVLCSCQSLGRLAENPTSEQREEVNARVKMIALAWPGEHPAYAQFSAALHIPESTHEQKLSHNELLRQTTSAVNAVALIYAIALADLREMLPRIRCPALVLHARGDSIIRFDEGRKVATLIPGARFVPLESRNHVLLASEPAWQHFILAYDEFVSRSSVDRSASLLNDLTPREREILEFVAQGVDNNAIAARFEISEKTVRNHVSIIFSKLGVKSRAHAVAVAREAGYGRNMVF